MPIEEYLPTPKVKVDNPKDTPSLERLASLEIFISKFQERWEQVIDQQHSKGKYIDEVFQSHKEEKRTTHFSAKNNDDIVEELEPEHSEKASICAPPFDAAIHEPFPSTQEEEDEVSHFPCQYFDETLFYDSESEGEMKSSGQVDPPCGAVEDV